jgi:hypothetical protein
LIEVNKNQEGMQCFDKGAVLAIFDTAEKTTLTQSTFVHTFEFGGTNGYWTGNHTIIQVEDCIDCLKVVFGEEY